MRAEVSKPAMWEQYPSYREPGQSGTEHLFRVVFGNRRAGNHTMAKRFIALILGLLLICGLSPVESQTLPKAKSGPSNPSSCSDAHGWMRISTEKFVGNLSCFSPEINRQYALIGGGGVNGRDDISIQMIFLSKSGTHSCKIHGPD